jgi:hypothetical protein
MHKITKQQTFAMPQDLSINSLERIGIQDALYKTSQQYEKLKTLLNNIADVFFKNSKAFSFSEEFYDFNLEANLSEEDFCLKIDAKNEGYAVISKERNNIADAFQEMHNVSDNIVSKAFKSDVLQPLVPRNIIANLNNTEECVPKIATVDYPESQQNELPTCRSDCYEGR